MINYKKKNKFVFSIGKYLEVLRVTLINICFFYLLFIKSRKGKIIKHKRRKILLINTGDLGDNILTFRFITALCNSSKYFVYILIKPPYQEIQDYLNYKCIILPWNKLKYKVNPFYKIKFLHSLRKFHFDIAFNLTPERGILNEELTLLSDAKEKWKFNKKEPFIMPAFKSFLDKKYNHNFSNSDCNEYRILKKLAQKLGLPATPGTLNCRKSKQKINICIAPFSSDINRNWSLAKFNLIIEELARGNNITILGSHDNLSQYLIHQRNNIIDLTGETKISQLNHILKNFDLFIGNDSGLTHYAIHLNVPVIAIIGGGMFNRFFPDKAGKYNRYIFHRMECFGCGWKCKYKKRYCISEVSTKEVLQNIYGTLNEYDNKVKIC